MTGPWGEQDIRRMATVTAADVITAQEWFQARVPEGARSLLQAVPRAEVQPAAHQERPVARQRAAALRALALDQYRPPFSWSSSLGYYLDRERRVVSWEALRALRQTLATSAAADASAWAAGVESITAWAGRMAGGLKAWHVTNASLAGGGLHVCLGPGAGMVEDELARQLGFLNRWAGQALADASVINAGRAASYARSARRSWERLRRADLEQRGFDQERNLLSGAENCDDCVEMYMRGWVPIGTLIEIGARRCLNNCACEIIYRSSVTGKQFTDTLED